MITIGIDNLDELLRQFDYLGSRISQPIARGINATAAKVVEAEQEGMRTHLDRPRDFTLKSLGTYKASQSHRNPSALVFVKPIAAAYLDTSIHGGEYEGLHPAKIRLDRYGNIPKRKGGPQGMAGLITNKRQFVGRIKTRSGQEIFGLFERAPYKRVPKPWRRHHPARARPIKPIKTLVFSSTSRRTEIMPYYRIAAREVERNLGIDIAREIDLMLEQLFPGARNRPRSR